VQRSKTVPKGAATFVAGCLARDSYMLTQHNRDEVTAELLGVDPAAVHKAVSDLPEGSDSRALVIALALVLGALEARAAVSGQYRKLSPCQGWVIPARESLRYPRRGWGRGGCRGWVRRWSCRRGRVSAGSARGPRDCCAVACKHTEAAAGHRYSVAALNGGIANHPPRLLHLRFGLRDGATAVNLVVPVPRRGASRVSYRITENPNGSGLAMSRRSVCLRESELPPVSRRLFYLGLFSQDGSVTPWSTPKFRYTPTELRLWSLGVYFSESHSCWSGGVYWVYWGVPTHSPIGAPSPRR
jgi:hypothetical protein